MCIAIYKPHTRNLTRDTLQRCFNRNPDGCGFTYLQKSKDGRVYLKIKKTMSFDVFYRQYTRATKNHPDSPFVIHFRVGTHGVKTKYNCHPFRVDASHTFIHNGIMHAMPACKRANKSDTQVFNQLFLRQLPDGWFGSDIIGALLAGFIGANNKLIILNINGSVRIINEKAGTWEDGIWYSNKSYMEVCVKKNDSWQQMLLEKNSDKVVSFATGSTPYGETPLVDDGLQEAVSKYKSKLSDTCVSCGTDVSVAHTMIDGVLTALCEECYTCFNLG